MKLTDTEWTVMNALWDDSPATVRDVLQRVEGETGWAYSTVKTLLERLAIKGALGVEKQGTASLFVPLVTREQARRSAVHTLLDRAFDGTFGSLLQHLAAEERLSPADRRELARLLAAEEEQA